MGAVPPLPLQMTTVTPSCPELCPHAVLSADGDRQEPELGQDVALGPAVRALGWRWPLCLHSWDAEGIAFRGLPWHHPRAYRHLVLSSQSPTPGPQHGCWPEWSSRCRGEVRLWGGVLLPGSPMPWPGHLPPQPPWLCPVGCAGWALTCFLYCGRHGQLHSDAQEWWQWWSWKGSGVCQAKSLLTRQQKTASGWYEEACEKAGRQQPLWGGLQKEGPGWPEYGLTMPHSCQGSQVARRGALPGTPYTSLQPVTRGTLPGPPLLGGDRQGATCQHRMVPHLRSRLHPVFMP